MYYPRSAYCDSYRLKPKGRSVTWGFCQLRQQYFCAIDDPTTRDFPTIILFDRFGKACSPPPPLVNPSAAMMAREIAHPPPPPPPTGIDWHLFEQSRSRQRPPNLIPARGVESAGQPQKSGVDPRCTTLDQRPGPATTLDQRPRPAVTLDQRPGPTEVTQKQPTSPPKRSLQDQPLDMTNHKLPKVPRTETMDLVKLVEIKAEPTSESEVFTPVEVDASESSASSSLGSMKEGSCSPPGAVDENRNQLHDNSDDEGSDSAASEKEHSPAKSRRPKPSLKTRNKKMAKLWEFLIFILNEKRFSALIAWTDRERGMFKCVNGEGLARLYSDYKHKCSFGTDQAEAEPMRAHSYSSMTRSFRYYYIQGILQRLPGKTKYRFGPRALGWETNTQRPLARASLDAWLESLDR